MISFRRFPKQKKAFTLIEVLIVISILAVTFSVLYTSFQVGLKAYLTLESDLTVDRETDIFFMQFSKELRKTFPYFKQPFQGVRNYVSFPAEVERYTAQGLTRDICLVEYRVEGNSLVRKERRLKKESLKNQAEIKEVVLDQISGVEFYFLQAGADEKLNWTKEWTNQPYVGVPRGIKIILKGKRFESEAKQFEILIPQGVLLEGRAAGL